MMTVIFMIVIVTGGGLLIALTWLLMRHPVTGVFCLLGGIALMAIIYTSCKPIYKTRTPLFAEDVKRVISADALQQWAVDTMADLRRKTNAVVQLDRDLVPKAIECLNSQGSPFQWADYYEGNPDAHESRIMLVWGDGFGHWGIIVGGAAFRLTKESDLFFIEWKPGVYFWHETH
jgi:hypothetical protein